MTNKNTLLREADEYVNSVYEFGRNQNGMYTQVQVKQAYIAGKKSMQKENTELKNQIEKMKELINRYYEVCVQIPKEYRTMVFDSCLEDTIQLNNKGVTMFEKEAEEYYNGQYDAWLEGEDGFALEEEIEQSFKDGAEFGYNKANEWHYVKDGKLDDVIDTWDKKRKYLIMARFTNDFGEYDEIPLLAYFYHSSGKWCTSKLDYLYKFYITWWKEIVLPKESE